VTPSSDAPPGISLSGLAPPRTETLADGGMASVRDRPRAKFYALTRAGQKQLAVEKDSWDRLTAAIRLIFNEGQ
jgi:DNA-binding PadR family transcriptional regulator